MVNMIPEYTNSQISYVIDEYVHSQRDRDLLKRHYVDGIRYAPLAEEFDLSERHVKTIVYREEGKLIKHLE